MPKVVVSEFELLRRRKRLLAELSESLKPELMRGSVVESSRKCGRASCVCVREGKRHRRTALSVNLAGKTRSIHLDAEREGMARAGVAAYARLWTLLDKLTELNLALLSRRCGARR